MSQRTPLNRYNATVLILSAAYAVALIGAECLFRHRLVAGSMSYAVAVLPALPIVGIFAAIGRYLVDERDEYVRQLMVRQTLVASGFALSFATVWGFLESFNLAGHVEAYFIAVLWFAGLGLGAAINRIGRSGRDA